jgi:MinD-like ATPase involved in chromosome partitioning or flagellar assembly
VRASELDAHFRTRVRSVVRMPYDPHLAAGSTVSFRDLQPATRLAARELAATVIEGLRILTAV